MSIKKSIFIIPVLLALLVLIPRGEARVKPYISGDVINFNSKIYIGTANTGNFEIFRLIDDKIRKELVIKSHDVNNQIFHDGLFAKEGSKLYVYLVNGRFILKYDITNLPSVRLVEKKQDNSNDYFFGLGLAGDRIFTNGSNGIKVWNDDLLVVSTYRIFSDYNRSLAFSNNGNYLTFVDESEIKIVDSFYRYDTVVENLKISEEHNRLPYFDSLQGNVYVVDDGYLRKISINENTDEFKHISELGYDVDGISGKNHVYFSDGVGIVKIRKNDLEPIDWEWTTELGGGNGWAMGLKVVDSNDGEIVVVFNGSSILAMDKNLDLLDYYEARDEAVLVEPLYLSANIYQGMPGMRINLQGGGFGSEEDLIIKFYNNSFYINADTNGSFQKTVIVPNSSPKITDIKAEGLLTGLTYSVSFEIY